MGLFWLIVLLVSLGCLYIVLVPLVTRGPEVSYTAETRYLPWTTTFPAVTVCETYVVKYVTKRMESYHPDFFEPMIFGKKRFLVELVFSPKLPHCTPDTCVPCGVYVPCDMDWRKLIERVRYNCTELLTECKENGKPFDCCKRFRQVDSENGPCYAYNTLRTKNPDNEPLFSVNRSTGPGKISFRVLADATISVHSNEQLSTNHLDEKFKFNLKILSDNKIDYTFSMVEFENDPMLEREKIKTRGCRYLHEVPDKPLHRYKVYSYGACKLAYDTERLFKECGCILPRRDLSCKCSSRYKEQYCNFEGMTCMAEYQNKQNMMGSSSDHDDPCVSSCTESELTRVHLSMRRVVDPNPIPGVNVTVQMAALPSLRYQRNLLRSNLDLVVSVGGMVGLFFGASIFSLVEIFYLFIRKQ